MASSADRPARGGLRTAPEELRGRVAAHDGGRTAAAPDAPAYPPRSASSGGIAPWGPRAADLVVVVGVVAVVLWQLHLPLLLSATTTTGGDTGAHFMMPAYFNSNLFPHLTGWDPAWYDGYPIYTFYFVLPDVLVALASHLISYDVAFKLATVLGSVLLPVAAWALGRLLGLRPPVPAALAAATLPFLFDYTWTIYGGNLFSTLAGEYAYSLSVALAVLFLGLFARGLRTGRHRLSASVSLAACILAHVVPGALALAGAAVLTAFEVAPARWRLRDGAGFPGRREPVGGGASPRWGAVRWAVSTAVIGILLCAWWLVPFVVRLPYSTSMNYTKVTTYVASLFPAADLWALSAAGAGVVVAIVRRSRFGLLLAVLGGISAAAVVLDPLRSLYNVRFLPLWFLCVYLLAGWLAGVAIAAAARWVRHERLLRWEWENAGDVADAPRAGDVADAPRAGDVADAPRAGVEPVVPPDRAPAPGIGRVRPSPPRARWSPGAVAGPLVAFVAALAVVVPPFVPSLASALPQIGVHPGANEVSVWAQWNYTGYEGKPDYGEYRGLMLLMARIGRRDGCGRAMWEYNADENRFGTPEALMLLPYWTKGCVDSMEGLLFESSATTPYHFLNQAELSVSPSEAVVGLPYGPLTVQLGVRHLQLLGVRYFMAASPQVEAAAGADPTLRLIATSGPWRTTYDGEQLDTTWKVYLVAHSAIVEPLSSAPAVLEGVGQSQTSWLGKIGPGDVMRQGPSLRWYLHPSAWRTELTAGGPAAWPRVRASRASDPPVTPVQRTVVSHVRVSAASVSFHVSRVGTPVLVKVSYFPNWHAAGADGPWRATPNLMVVVPTSHDVTLTYGTTAVTEAGDAATLAGVLALLGLGLRRWAGRRGGRVARGARIG